MEKPATAFDYSDKERHRLYQCGIWLTRELNGLPLKERLELAQIVAQGSILKMVNLAQLLVQGGPRVVLFEDVAFRLHWLLLYFLNRNKLGFDSVQAIQAAPFLEDVGKFIERARQECQRGLRAA